MVQTATLAYGRAVPYEDLSFLLLGYLADLTASALRTWRKNGDARSWMPYGVISGMIFAAGARASFGVRSDWWSKLDLRRRHRIHARCIAPPAVSDLSH